MKVTLQKGGRLGSGSFSSTESAVYRATEFTTGRVVALKQSRVSLRLKRPHLQYEAQVLRLLAGHPAIPQVYAYVRVKHFEFLSMQLLHQTLRDAVKEKGPLPVGIVVEIADQILSALDHIHSKSLVHRDIKPDNILLLDPGSWHVCLIDFGLAYPAPKEVPGVGYMADASKSITVFGTLAYASLNAHEGRKLTYRDDLESLSYTLLYLLRGSLPWSHYTKHGTVHGQIRQVRAQKLSSNGPRLAVGLPSVFGELVEYARSMPAEKIPNYEEWKEILYEVAQVANREPDDTGGTSSYSPDLEVLDTRPSAPIQPGQIALVRLISSITTEGYSIRAGHETSFIPDSCFSAPEWDCPVRPCVILAVKWDGRAKTYKFNAAPLSRNRELEQGNSLKVRVVGVDSSSLDSAETTVVPEPDWPLKCTYCYAFKRPAVFYCLPSQAKVHTFWKIDQSGVESLISALIPPRNPDSFALFHNLQSSEPDTRHDAKMKAGYVKFYVQISPLEPAQFAGESLDWNSSRGWFDECVKAARYYDMCNGAQWSQSQFDNGSEENLPNSYDGSDLEEWERLEERDRSLTLGPIFEGNCVQPTDLLEWLDEIELVA